MINVKKNIEINNKLSELYLQYTKQFLDAYAEAFNDPPPPRINEFGIINVEKYDADNGILFIGKETNDWQDDDFNNGILFRSWLCDISHNGLDGHGKVKQHPTIWYNTGRWAEAILHPEKKLDEIISMKQDALSALGNIAITNINKARGDSSSKKEYYHIAYSDVAGEVLCKELEILAPKIIVTLGNFRTFCYHAQKSNIFNNGTTVVAMPHPSARKSAKEMIANIAICANRNE